VVIATAAGLAVVALDQVARGVITTGPAIVVGAFARLLLPAKGPAIVVGAFARLLLPANRSGMLGARSSTQPSWPLLVAIP
jgi:hypothetical protein